MEIKVMTADELAKTEFSAEHITELHYKAKSNLSSAIDAAIEVGEELQKAKTALQHGAYLPWIESNLPFDERTAQRYVKMYLNNSELKKLQPSSLSEAYGILTEPKEEPEEDVKIEAYIKADDYDEEEGDELDPVVAIEPIYSKYPYWKELEQSIKQMNDTYKKLSSKRDHTTPQSVGFMIGNLKEMAMRLEEWNPDNLFDCPRCGGTQQIPSDAGPTTCPVCIHGKVGPYRKTEL